MKNQTIARFLGVFIDPFMALFRHRSLILTLTKRNIEATHKGSLMGGLWPFLESMVVFSAYLVVFGLIFDGKFHESALETKTDHALAIFLGLSIFHFLSEILISSPGVLRINETLVKKFVFPLEILPVTIVTKALYSFSITMALFFVAKGFIGRGVEARDLLFIVYVINLFFFAQGLSWILAAVGTYLKDLERIFSALNIVILFSSAVFYSPLQIPEKIWVFLKYNPVLYFVSESRILLLWNEHSINLYTLKILTVISFAIFLSGYHFFSALKKDYAEAL